MVVGPVVLPAPHLGVVLRVLVVRVVHKVLVVLRGLVLPVLVQTGLLVGLTSGSLLPAGTPARSRPRPRGSDRFRPRRGRRLRRLRRTGSRMLP